MQRSTLTSGLRKLWRSYRKYHVIHIYQKFIRSINSTGTFLDVGCGNDSSYKIKTQHPSIYYVGIDVQDYRQTKPNLADEYIISTAEQFPENILNLGARFDTVMSSHNLEHVNDRGKTLDAMIKAVKRGGDLYLAFPSKVSVNAPRRKNTLNYYDDHTHKDTPPDFNEIIMKLKSHNMKIIFARRSYKPFFLYWAGFFKEKQAKIDNIATPEAWAYWGFEAIIWARKS